MRLDENQKRVFNEFRLNKRASKADVSLKVNLTHPAVTQIVRKLCESGYLKEDEEKRNDIQEPGGPCPCRTRHFGARRQPLDC